MRSPSSLRLNLMVPCEAGCDGPICSSMISSAGSAASIFCDQRAGSDMTTLLLRRPQRLHDWIDLRNQRLALLKRIILSQRMADEGIVEQDAAQVGMAVELDAEQIVAFALEPVGRLPDRIHARRPCIVARTDPNLHAQPMIFA